MVPNSRPPVDARMRGNATRLSIFAATVLLFGCAAPGVPVARRSAVPQTISDLSAKQSGASTVLSFTLPKETIEGRPLSKPLAFEIYRAFGISEIASAQLRLVTTVPPGMVNKYEENGQIHFFDVFSPEDFSAYAGGNVAYVVRTRLTRHDSDASNLIRIRILPAPQPIEDLHAQITRTAVELSWTPPSISPAKAAPPASLRYQIYRSEAPVGALNSAKSDGLDESQRPVLLGQSVAPSYADRDFAFGRAYSYIVRSVAAYEDGSVESGDSNLLNVTPRDTFAPATPLNLAATATGANGAVGAHVDLSWAINSETNLLGYNVYRSETANSVGMRVNSTPLMTPVFRDDAVATGERYSYRVTAIDRARNESAPSAPVTVTVPASNEQRQP
jgi:hypothetical protein